MEPDKVGSISGKFFSPDLSVQRGRLLRAKRKRFIDAEVAETADFKDIISCSARVRYCKDVSLHQAKKSSQAPKSDKYSMSLHSCPRTDLSGGYISSSNNKNSEKDRSKWLKAFGVEEHVNAFLRASGSASINSVQWPTRKDQPYLSVGAGHTVLKPGVTQMYNGNLTLDPLNNKQTDSHAEGLLSGAVKQFRPVMIGNSLVWHEDHRMIPAATAVEAVVASPPPPEAVAAAVLLFNESLRPVPLPLRQLIRDKADILDCGDIVEFKVVSTSSENISAAPAATTATTAALPSTAATVVAATSTTTNTAAVNTTTGCSATTVYSTTPPIIQQLPRCRNMFKVAAKHLHLLPVGESRPRSARTNDDSNEVATTSSSSRKQNSSSSSSSSSSNSHVPVVNISGSNSSSSSSNNSNNESSDTPTTTTTTTPVVVNISREEEGGRGNSNSVTSRSDAVRLETHTLECALGRHFEGIADSVLQLIFDKLVPSSSTSGTNAGATTTTTSSSSIEDNNSNNSNNRNPTYIDYCNGAWKELGSRLGSRKRITGVKRNIRAEKKHRIATTSVVLKSMIDSRGHLLEPQTQQQPLSQTQPQQPQQAGSSSSSGGEPDQDSRRNLFTWKDVLDTLQQTAFNGGEYIEIHRELPQLQLSPRLLSRFRGRLLGLFQDADPPSLRRQAPKGIQRLRMKK